jgi:O-antigen biosynthesis protein
MSLSGWLRTAAMVCSRPNLGVARKNLALWMKALGDRDARKTIELLFDPVYYLDTQTDVRDSGVHPFLHYLVYGFLEGRNPSTRLDNNYYRVLYEDVGRARINPLVHYALFGQQEGRSLLPVRTKVLEIRAWDDPVVETSAGVRLARIDNSWPRGRPLVSVIIPCFNYGQYVEEALDSVLAQTFQDFEVVIVEGGSTDGVTPGIIAAIEDRNYGKVRVLYRSEPRMVGDNRNFAISHARGRYVCCLDADDLLKPTYLEMAVFLAESFGYDVVTSSLQCFGDSRARWVLEDPSFPAICIHNQIATTALFRRSAWAHVGGYRDWGLGREYIPEDWDFWVRMLGHGYRAKSIREPLMNYRVHNFGLTAACGTGLEFQRGALRRANDPLFQNPANTPRFMVVEMANRWSNIAMPLPDSPPSILIALPFIAVGGAEKLFHTVCEGLAAKSYGIVIVTTLLPPETMKEVPDCYSGITSHVYRLPHLLEPDNWPDFVQYLIRRYRVESVLLAGSDFMYRQLRALREQFPHLRIVDQQFNGTGHIQANRTYSDLIDCTSVPSSALARLLIEHYKENPAKVAVIPHGIDTHGPILNREEVWAASGLPEHARGKLLVSFFGRMSKEKSPEVFVNIAERLVSRGDVYFVMTGEGPEWKSVRRRAGGRRLKHSIHLPGFVDDPRPLMQLTDIVVLTSSVDGMPLVILEAGALGRPVVASAVGSLPEMVLDGETGFLCPPGDVDAFCRAIEQLVDSESLRRRFGERARQYVRERFDREAMIESYAAILDCRQ